MKLSSEKFVGFGFTGLLSVILCVLTAGCMVGPDYERPQTLADTAEGYIYASGHLQDVNEAVTVGRWWERFADETTTELVELALNNNYDLEAAAARVLQAEAALAEISGQQWPQVSYDFTRARNKTSFNFGGVGRFSNLSTTYAQNIRVSYLMDLFGRLKRSERAAWADLLASEASRQVVVNAIISSVVKARANIATLQRQVAIARANTENWQRNRQIIERRYNRGLVGSLDVRLARENLEASKATEITFELLLIKARNAMDVLLARQPGSGQGLAETMADLPELEPVPVGLPALLLDRRPDVRSAEMALKSANEQIGVNIAAMYPDLTLTGAVGRSADRWRDIWLSETETYSTVFNFVQPIFKGGQLRARVNRAKARYTELAANYAQTVVTAMREVEDALITEEMLQRRFKALQLRFQEAAAAEKLARDRYVRGVERLIIVLETERRRRIAEDALNIIKGRLWAGRVDIFLALGGDWVDNLEQAKD